MDLPQKQDGANRSSIRRRSRRPLPIKAEFRHFYGRQWRTVTRPRILERAKNACERCKAPNHKIVMRHPSWPGVWIDCDQAPAGRIAAYDENGRPRPDLTLERLCEDTGEYTRNVWIVLTVAHLDHTPGHDWDENLKALCQRCHLIHDRHQHVGNARQTRTRKKDEGRPLLQLLQPA